MSYTPAAPITPINPLTFPPIKPIMPYTSAPVFDPAVLLTLKFQGRSVVVPRDHCSDYDVGHSPLGISQLL